MSLHLTESRAHAIASARELEAAKLGLRINRSSGHRYLRYGVRRQFFVLWEVYPK